MPAHHEPDRSPSPYLSFSRAEWSRLRAATQLTLSEAELAALRGLNEAIALDEVSDIYLPLARLLNLYIVATQNLAHVTDRFLGTPAERVPYVVGIAGSVAVGKSTTARLLQALLARWPEHPRVALVTTDGFLYPNATLAARGLMERKGFPESYDVRRLVRFVADLKSGAWPLAVPVYSHVTYDVLPGVTETLAAADVVIVEGLNVLQRDPDVSRVFVSDFFDFSIYVDAAEADLRQWFGERFQQLRDGAFRDPASYFKRFATLSDAEALALADQIWTTINAVNLHEHILPTRDRAQLVLEKGPSHAVQQVRLRKV